MTAITLAGQVTEIGYLGDNVGAGTDYGLTIETSGGQKITVSGMTVDQVRSIKSLAFESAEITIKESS